MKNKTLKFLITLFFLNILTSNSIGEIQFNFDVTNLEIINNGNTFKGSNRGVITTNDGIIIEANMFEYNKDSNILKAKGNVQIDDTIQNYTIIADNIIYLKDKEIIITNGKSKGFDKNGKIITAETFNYNKNLNILNAKENVKIEDTVQDYIIFAKNITYLKNIEKVFTEGKTQLVIKSKYNIQTEDIIFLLNESELSSNKKTIVKDDDSHIYYLDKFHYSINSEKLNGENILIISNFGLPKSDKFYFSNAIINLKNNDFIAKDTKVEIHEDVFGDKDNDPRLKGISSRRDGNIITVKKGIFTSCEENEKCPPWSIQAQQIKHDKNEKKLIYNNAILRVYDIPIFYFPKFFHPDPTVKRQSGLLTPQLNNSNILGNSITIPYYHVVADNSDFTFKSSIFDKDILMIQTEYRQINKYSSLITDFGYTKGYNSASSGKKKDINHLFGKYDLDLNLDTFQSSELSLVVERTNNDNYLKVFDSNLTNGPIKPKNFDVLNSELKFKLNHENYNLVTGVEAYENLQLNNSDRYHYILPYYQFDKNLSQNFINGSLSLTSSGTNELKDTNNLRSKINNDILYRGFDLITNFGLVNNFNVNLKNLNSTGKNDNVYKSDLQIEGMSSYELQSSLPLIKKNDQFEQSLTPKLSLRFSPNDMKDNSLDDRKVDVSNIFSNNRLGLGDSFEGGRSLTVGIDYKKEGISDINKYFDLKLATVLRDKEENSIPKVSTLNRKTSNLFGSISTNFKENLDVEYNFALDNDLKTFEHNSILTTLSINSFVTKFKFIEEGGEMGDINTINNSTSYRVNDNNYITFNTRRNRKLNLTEYYDLVYQYKNDCLIAGVKYKKNYYQDRDIKPTENLFFTVTLFPLTTLEQKIDQ
jgi:LPS-assembly protein